MGKYLVTFDNGEKFLIPSNTKIQAITELAEQYFLTFEENDFQVQQVVHAPINEKEYIQL